jgi:hypothetical protein
MRNWHAALWGSEALVERPHSSNRESFRLILLIWGCFLLYALSSNAPVCGAESYRGDDQFVQKLQLPRDPEPILKEILSRSEFKDAEQESWIDKLRILLYETLKKIFDWIRDRIPKVKWPQADLDIFRIIVGSFVVAAVLVLATVLVIYATRSLGRNRLYVEEVEDLGFPDAATSAAVRASAVKNAEQGNFREALIGMFRYVLLWLDERGRLALHQVKTNREVLESLKNDVGLRNTLGEMIPIFNRVRYGNYPCDKKDYERFLALCSRVDGGT